MAIDSFLNAADSARVTRTFYGFKGSVHKTEPQALAQA